MEAQALNFQLMTLEFTHHFGRRYLTMIGNSLQKLYWNSSSLGGNGLRHFTSRQEGFLRSQFIFRKELIQTLHRLP